MKILIVIENYFPHIGGVEVVFQNLAEGFASRGHDVLLVTHQLKGTKKFEIKNKVKIYRIPCFGSRYLFTFFSIPKVLKLARTADIIHTTTFNGAFPAWLASKLLKKPAIITVHEVWIRKWKKFTDFGPISAALHELLERAVYFLNFDKFVAVSNSTKQQLKEIGKTNIEAIYNGVNYSHFNPKKHREKARRIRKRLGLEKKFVCLTYGRPGPSKGIKYAIQAFPEILKKVPNAYLLLILSKDKAYIKKYREILKMIKDLGISNQVKVLEPVPFKDLPAYIKVADCVIVPSLSEGFGYSVAESCAMGVPVVASNTTSIPEVISGEHVLVEPRSPEKIAEGVVQIYKGKAKKTRLKKFLWKDAIKKYLKIYCKLTS